VISLVNNDQSRARQDNGRPSGRRPDRDQGDRYRVGIKPEQQERLFRRSSSSAKRMEGTGLLYLSQKLAGLLGDASSARALTGRVASPLILPDGQSSSIEPWRPKVRLRVSVLGREAAARILVVEDNATNLDLMIIWSRPSHADSGEDGEEDYSAGTPAITLLRYQLPRLSKLVARRLRDSRLRTIPWWRSPRSRWWATRTRCSARLTVTSASR
jgi:hypothetical protein